MEPGFLTFTTSSARLHNLVTLILMFMAIRGSVKPEMYVRFYRWPKSISYRKKSEEKKTFPSSLASLECQVENIFDLANQVGRIDQARQVCVPTMCTESMS